MPQKTPEFFEFEGLQFYPDQALIVRARDSSRSFIRPKEQQLLEMLLSRSGETITYKELWVALWPEIKDFAAARRTMTETRSTLDKLLREILKSDVSIIQTISKVGYRIQAPVVSSLETCTRQNFVESPLTTELSVSQPETTTSTISSLFSNHRWHALGSCALYSGAYVCILLLEVAYSSDYWPGRLS